MATASKSAARRGRPRNPDRAEGRYKEQLVWKAAREAAGLSQEQFAQAINLSPAYVGDIENGFRRFNSDTLAKFQSVSSVLAHVVSGQHPSIPITCVIGVSEAPESRGKLPMYEAPVPKRRRDLLDCIAIEVGDDSADRDFPFETVLYVRPIQHGDRLRVGQPLVGRFRQNGEKITAYGILDRTVTGDLVLLTRSHNPDIPACRTLQSGSERLRSMPQRILDSLPRETSGEYWPRPDDPGEIIGLVVYALGPV